MFSHLLFDSNISGYTDDVKGNDPTYICGNLNVTSGTVLDYVGQHTMYVHLFKYSWQEGRNSVAGL